MTSHGFYNPQTGRWLNRDPLNERGFTVLERSRKSLDHDEDKHLYGYLKNATTAKADALGLQIEAEKAGYCKDPCAEYAAGELAENPGWMLDGAPICCGGQIYLCSWGQERMKNSRAKAIAKECAENHERRHASGDLEACAPCNWSATKPEFRSGVEFRAAECEAYKVEVLCLDKGKCLGDPECEVEIEQRRKSSEIAADAFCSSAPKPKRP